MTAIAPHAHLALVLALVAPFAATSAAHAESSTAASVDIVSGPPFAAPPAPTATVPSYSLPWQLRPVTAGNALRLESTAAVFNDAQGNLDIGVATVLAANYQVTSDWAAMMRLGFVGNDAPGAAVDGTSFVNPLVGATYTRSRGSYRLALFGATTIPVGSGGGNAPNVGASKTNAASTMVRPADTAMFAVNYLTTSAGAGFAYLNHRFTAQVEATLTQWIRVRGAQSAEGTDPFRTNGDVGLHLGYFLGTHVSLGADMRYQRWLSHPTTLFAPTGAHVPYSDASMDLVTVAAGPRVHFRVGKRAWLRPGISVVRGLDARGVDAPLITAQTTAVQLDVPITF